MGSSPVLVAGRPGELRTVVCAALREVGVRVELLDEVESPVGGDLSLVVVDEARTQRRPSRRWDRVRELFDSDGEESRLADSVVDVVAAARRCRVLVVADTDAQAKRMAQRIFYEAEINGTEIDTVRFVRADEQELSPKVRTALDGWCRPVAERH